MIVRNVVDRGGAAVVGGYGTALISSFCSSSSFPGLKWDGVSAEEEEKRGLKCQKSIKQCGVK